MAPAKAAPAMAQPDNAPRAQQTVTAKPAPALTPIILGEANRLCSTIWITAPDTARAAPDSRQAAVLGRREYQKINPAVPWGPASSALYSWFKVSFTEPRQILSSAAATQSSSAPPMTVFLLFIA